MNTAIILVVVLSVLIFVHEFGHFVMAKLFGTGVEEFGFGFPPRLFGIRRGETTYSVNWIPLGGFVKIQGENGADTKDPRNFGNKKVWQRAVILCAGVFMNLVLAWGLLTVGFLVGLPAAVEELPANARISDAKIQVMSVLDGSSAAAAGLQAGDVLLSVDGLALNGIEQFQTHTGAREGETVSLTYRRNGDILTVGLVPRMMAETARAGVGVAIIQTGLVSYPLWLAPIQAVGAVGYYVQEILSAFGGLIRDLAVGQPVGVEFSGPVGIAVITAEVTQMGFRYLLQFIALLSVNLAVVNILPLPALDGGRVVFLIVEKIRRRPVSVRIESAVHNFGFAALMVLVLVVTYRDVVNFGDRIKQAFGW